MTDSELLKFLERIGWNLWEEIEDKTIPQWLKKAMERQQVWHCERDRIYYFKGHTFIYKVEVFGQHCVSIMRSPRNLDARLPILIKNLKEA